MMQKIKWMLVGALIFSFIIVLKVWNGTLSLRVGENLPTVEEKGLSLKCDDSLWQHVYSGDPRKFSKPQDRLKIITPCMRVTGILKTAKAEADGDLHIRLALDPQFTYLLNAKNISGQQGDLVLEPVCERAVTQKDTLAEGSCDNFHQNIFDPSMIGKRIEVVGVYVEDQEHGWRELHPVTSITVI